MLWSGFILGFLGSLHCIGMCGPIAFMLPVDHNNASKKTLQITVYHFGRLLAYASLGLLFGLLGKSLTLFGWQQQLSIGIGVLMILMIVLPHKITSKFSVTRAVYKTASKLKLALGKNFKKKTLDAFFTIGFLNGLLPCGLVYMAVFGAIATGSLTQGGTYMVLFGFGTIPLMTTAIHFGKFVNAKTRHYLSSVIPVIVVVIGILFILRGMGLDIPYISPSNMVAIPEATATHSCH